MRNQDPEEKASQVKSLEVLSAQKALELVRVGKDPELDPRSPFPPKARHWHSPKDTFLSLDPDHQQILLPHLLDDYKRLLRTERAYAVLSYHIPIADGQIRNSQLPLDFSIEARDPKFGTYVHNLLENHDDSKRQDVAEVQQYMGDPYWEHVNKHVWDFHCVWSKISDNDDNMPPRAYGWNEACLHCDPIQPCMTICKADFGYCDCDHSLLFSQIISPHLLYYRLHLLFATKEDKLVTHSSKCSVKLRYKEKTNVVLMIELDETAFRVRFRTTDRNEMSKDHDGSGESSDASLRFLNWLVSNEFPDSAWQHAPWFV